MTKIIPIALLAICLLSACSFEDSNVETGNRNGIFHLGNGAEPQSLDPHVLTGVPESTIVGTLFEGLVILNPYTLDIEPGVAEKWTFSEDRRVITFHLNPEARWSNGDSLTAKDFVWSWQRALNPALGNLNAEKLFPVKNAEAISSGAISNPELLGVQALSPLILEVTLNEPTSYFLQLLDDITTYPVHRQTIEKFGSATERYTKWTRPGNIVSNGPFKLKEWNLNRNVIVEKNPSYWGAADVHLNGIVFHPIEDIVVEERMYRAGQLHYTYTLPLGKISAYQAMPNSPLKQAPYLGTYYFMVNTNQPPLDDVRVRRALAMAIDRETLTDTLLHNIFLPNYSFTPAGISGYQPPVLFGYDVGTARELLAQAGYPDGENWPGIEITYNTDASHQKVVVALQQMWKKALNIDVTLVNMEWKVYLDAISQRDFQMARAAWVGGPADPLTYLRLLNTGGGNNGTGFANSKYDELIFKTATKASSPSGRYAVLREAESILLEEMPVIPMFSYTSIHLVHPTVNGLPSNLLDTVNFRYVSLEAEQGH